MSCQEGNSWNHLPWASIWLLRNIWATSQWLCRLFFTVIIRLIGRPNVAGDCCYIEILGGIIMAVNQSYCNNSCNLSGLSVFTEDHSFGLPLPPPSATATNAAAPFAHKKKTSSLFLWCAINKYASVRLHRLRLLCMNSPSGATKRRIYLYICYICNNVRGSWWCLCFSHLLQSFFFNIVFPGGHWN